MSLLCHCVCTASDLLNLVGTLPDVNTFRVSAKDLARASTFVLKLPAFEAAVNASLQAGDPLPRTSVIINVLYDEDFTGYGADPSGTLDSSRPLAGTVALDGIALGGLFSAPVSFHLMRIAASFVCTSYACGFMLSLARRSP